MIRSTPNYQAPEIITVPPDTNEVACDGGNPALGHPKVYYTFDGKDRVTCGYCDREFVRNHAVIQTPYEA